MKTIYKSNKRTFAITTVKQISTEKREDQLVVIGNLEKRGAIRPIRALVVNIDKEFRRSINPILQHAREITIVGEAENGAAAIDAAACLNPHVVLMDIMMPRMDGIAATQEICERFPWIRVLGFSSCLNYEAISKMLKTGAAGFLSKNCSPEEMIMAIRRVAEGGYWLGSEATAMILAVHRFTSNTTLADMPNEEETAKTHKLCVTDEDKLVKLSTREKEVLLMIASGKSRSQIASALFISVKTVDVHREKILGKLDLRNTAEIVHYAMQTGLFDPRLLQVQELRSPSILLGQKNQVRYIDLCLRE